MYRSYTYLVRFIPEYCVFFDAMVLYFISVSDHSLLLYRIISHLWISSLFLATLLNPHVSSSSFGKFQGTFDMDDYVFCKYRFTSFLTWLCFVSLSWLMILVRNSKTKVHKDRHVCIIYHLRGKALSVTFG